MSYILVYLTKTSLGGVLLLVRKVKRNSTPSEELSSPHLLSRGVHPSYQPVIFSTHHPSVPCLSLSHQQSVSSISPQIQQ